MSESPNNLASYIWSLADLLRGDFKQSQYGRIILPFTLLRRLECVLEPTKDKLTEIWRKANHDQLLARIQQERESRHQQQLTDWQQAVEQWEQNGKEGKKPAKPKKPTEFEAIKIEVELHQPKEWIFALNVKPT